MRFNPHIFFPAADAINKSSNKGPTSRNDDLLMTKVLYRGCDKHFNFIFTLSY